MRVENTGCAMPEVVTVFGTQIAGLAAGVLVFGSFAGAAALLAYVVLAIDWGSHDFGNNPYHASERSDDALLGDTTKAGDEF